MEVELHDGTVLEFPDGTDMAVVKAAARRYMAKQAPPPNDVPPAGDMSQWQQTPPGLAPSAPTFGEDLAGGAAATAKGAIKGATAIPGMLADAPFQVANLFGANQQLPSQSQSAMLDQAFGDTSGYQSVENLANAATGAVVPAAMAGRAAQGASATVAPMLEAAAAAPGTQMVAGVTGEGGRQLAEAGGAGAVGQTAGALLGGMAGVMAPQALGDLGRGAGRALYRGLIEPGTNPEAPLGRALVANAGKSAGQGLLDSPDDQAWRMAQALKEYDNVLPGSKATAAEAARAEGIIAPEFAALEDAVAAATPGPKAVRDAERRAARLKPFDDIIGAPDDQAALEARLEDLGGRYEKMAPTELDPRSVAAEREQMAEALRMRQAQALQLAGKFQTDAAQQRTLSRSGVVAPPATNTGTGVTTVQPRAASPNSLTPADEMGLPTSPSGFPEQRVTRSAYPAEGLPTTEGTMEGISRTPAMAGAPRIPERYTENAQRVPEAEAAAADAKQLADQLKREAGGAEQTTEFLRSRGQLNEVGFDELASHPAMQDAMRYAELAPGEQPTVGKVQAVKTYLDRAINGAQKRLEGDRGNPGYNPESLKSLRTQLMDWMGRRSSEWRNTKKMFEETSTDLDRIKVAEALRQKMVPAGSADKPLSHTKLANAMQDEGKFIEKTLNSGRFEDFEALGWEPQQIEGLRAVERDLANEINRDAMSTAGRGGMNVGAGVTKTSPDESVHKISLPKFLSWKASLVSDILRRVGLKHDQELAEKLADVMLSPQRTGMVMDKALRDAEGAKRLAAGLRYGRSARASAAGSMAGNVGTNGE
jgi:hypothetical protein